MVVTISSDGGMGSYCERGIELQFLQDEMTYGDGW